MANKQKETTQDNLVILIGRITKMSTKGKITSFKVKIPHRGKDGAVQAHFPKIICFEEDKTGIMDFVAGDSVKITGHIVNTRKRTAEGAYFYSQAIIGDKVEKNESLYLTQMNLPDVDFMSAQPVSLVYLHGVVENIARAGEKALRIRLNAMQNGRNNHVEVVSYQKDAMLVHPGDTITVYGKIETRSKEVGDSWRVYQNVITQRIVNNSAEET